ncbi:MAG: ROK family protein [Nakamurella sp.]
MSSAGSPPRPVTSHQLRRVSADALLAVLRMGEVMTASELMEATGFSRTSVHEVCADLLRLGRIVEVDGSTTPGALSDATGTPGAAQGMSGGRGRPPRRYAFAAGSGAVVAVDLGVHTITVWVTDLRGVLRGAAERTLLDPVTADRTTVLDELVGSALAGAGMRTGDVLVAVVGVPSSVSAVQQIEYPAEQRGVALATAWATGHGWPVLIENDANLAALGERWSGVARSLDNVVVVLAGERLGAGILMGGRLVRGEHGSAGELRFVSLMPAIGPEVLGIARHARELAAAAIADGTATFGAPAQRPAVDGAAALDTPDVSARTVFRAAADGDESALRIVRTVCERLAQLVGVLATLLDPAMVVISGGIADAGRVLVDTIQQLLPAAMIDNPPLVAASSLGADAVVTGGVRLGLDHLERHLLDGLVG